MTSSSIPASRRLSRSSTALDRADVVARTDEDLGAMLDFLFALRVPSGADGGAGSRDVERVDRRLGRPYSSTTGSTTSTASATTRTLGSMMSRRRTGARSRWQSTASPRSTTCRPAARPRTSASPSPFEAAPSEAQEAGVDVVAPAARPESPIGCRRIPRCRSALSTRLEPTRGSRTSRWVCGGPTTGRKTWMSRSIAGRTTVQTRDARLLRCLRGVRRHPDPLGRRRARRAATTSPAFACSINSSRSRSSCTTKAEPVKCPASQVRRSEVRMFWSRTSASRPLRNSRWSSPSRSALSPSERPPSSGR